MFFSRGDWWKMKLFAFLSTRNKDKTTPIQIDLEGGVTIEPVALMEKSTQTNQTSSCTIKCIIPNLSCFLICALLSTAFYRCFLPPLTDNTNPNRTIHLNKSDAGYGLEVDWWNAISEISPGSAAELNGQIRLGEELLVINGVSLHRTRFSNATIQSLFETRHDDVELVVAPMHKSEFASLVKEGAYFCVPFYIILFVVFFAINIYVPVASLTENSNPNRTVFMNKSDAGYGLTLDGWGWNEITEIAPGSAADVDGQIKIGEEILSINGVKITQIRSYLQTSAVLSLLETSHDGVQLVVAEAYRDPIWLCLARAFGATCLFTIFAFEILLFAAVDWWKTGGRVMTAVAPRKNVILFYCAAFLVFFLFPIPVLRWWFPPFTGNTNPNRTVNLNRSDAGYGLALDGWKWNTIAEVSIKSVTDFKDQIMIDEELLAINGVNLHWIRPGNVTFHALLETRQEGVELVLAPAHRDPLWLSAAVSLGIVLIGFSGGSLFTFAIPILLNWWSTLGTVTHTLKLFLAQEGTGFKFRMTNGKISEVTPEEAADCHGIFKEGDVILSVNDVSVEGLPDWRIYQLLNTDDYCITVIVRRKESK